MKNEERSYEQRRREGQGRNLRFGLEAIAMGLLALAAIALIFWAWSDMGGAGVGGNIPVFTDSYSSNMQAGESKTPPLPAQ